MGNEIDADPGTIQVLKESNGLWRDKSNVFIGSRVIAGADVQTFEIIDSYFYRDKRAVYLMVKRFRDLIPRPLGSSAYRAAIRQTGSRSSTSTSA